MNHVNRIARAIVWSPVVWGGLATLAFYTPLELARLTPDGWGRYVAHPFMLRYFAGHWVEYFTTALFFVGLASLILKAMNLYGQRAILATPLLDAIPPGGQDVAHCENLLARLAGVPYAWQESYLVRRLREALEFVYRKNSAEGLDEETRYLSDLDAGRMQSSYALVWFVIWAVPIMGFLGTIIGITNAVASLSPQAIESSLSTVTSGLGVAFDTTALSLSLAIVLMFVKYFIERYEGNLLERVDERANAELVGRFQDSADDRINSTPEVAVIRRMAETVVESTERLVTRQAELWQQSLRLMHEHWSKQTTATGETLQAALSGALATNLQQHAVALSEAERAMTAANQRHWESLQQTMRQSTEAMLAQQRELGKQGEVLLQVVGATEQVTRLEQELNRNLSALAGASHFEETVISLSAAIGLLSARLGQPVDAPRVELKHSRKGQAA